MFKLYQPWNYTPPGICYIGGPGGEPGNGPGDGQPPAGGSNNGPDWASYTRSLDNLGPQISGFLGEKLDKLTEVVTHASTPPTPTPVEPNWDTLTPKETYDLVTDRVQHIVQSAIDEALKPFADQVVSVRRDVADQQGQREIERMVGQHKDFADWAPEMMELAKAHTSLNVSQLYQLAKAGNAEKAKQVEAKYAPPPPPRPFSAGTSLSRPAGAPAPMSREQASKQAYAEVSARHPGALPALEQFFGQGH